MTPCLSSCDIRKQLQLATTQGMYLLQGKDPKTIQHHQSPNWVSVKTAINGLWRSTSYSAALMHVTRRFKDKDHRKTTSCLAVKCRSKQAVWIRAKDMQLDGAFRPWVSRTGLAAFLWDFSGQGIEAKDGFSETWWRNLCPTLFLTGEWVKLWTHPVLKRCSWS